MVLLALWSWFAGITTFVFGLGSPAVPIVFEGQSDEAHPYSNEYHDEHSSDVADADSVALTLQFLAGYFVVLPPGGLQVF